MPPSNDSIFLKLLSHPVSRPLSHPSLHFNPQRPLCQKPALHQAPRAQALTFEQFIRSSSWQVPSFKPTQPTAFLLIRPATTHSRNTVWNIQWEFYSTWKVGAGIHLFRSCPATVQPLTCFMPRLCIIFWTYCLFAHWRKYWDQKQSLSCVVQVQEWAIFREELIFLREITSGLL